MRGVRLMRARGSVVSVSARGPVLSGFPPGVAWGREERSWGTFCKQLLCARSAQLFPSPTSALRGGAATSLIALDGTGSGL